FDRIFEYLDMSIDIKDAPNAYALVPSESQGWIAFKNVTFTYKRDVPEVLLGLVSGNSKGDKNGLVQAKHPSLLASMPKLPMQEVEPVEAVEEFVPRPALKNVSFDIRPGQLAALVGPSGAGKTTITYLVPRLYEVDSGEVEIDGHNVKDM